MTNVPATVVNPLNRAPLALILDDSAPCVNLSRYWIPDRAEWKRRRFPGQPLHPADGVPERIASHPDAIPADFARRFAEWSLEEGVCGKFSVIPYPACLGRIDERIPGHSDAELRAWLDVCRDLLRQNYDLTPEMLTHTYVVDLDTWTPTDDWEQYEWEYPVDESLLTDYIAKSLEILRNVGIVAEGVTSPGGFGGRMEERYARATLAASQRVNGNSLPYYFKRIYTEQIPDAPVYEMRPEAPEAVVSIIACTGDWFGGWTGYDLGSPDPFIAEDLRSGRVVQVIEAGAPAILCGHWPGFYFGGDELGFDVMREVKRRLDAYDPDRERTLWMKTNDIARYFAVKEMASVRAERNGDRVLIALESPFGCLDFTLRLSGVRLRGVEMPSPVGEIRWMPEMSSQARFKAPGFYVDGNDTLVGLHLDPGVTELVARV